MVSHEVTGIMHVWEDCHRDDVPSRCTGYQQITGDIKLDHLVKVESARFLHCKVSIFFPLN